MTPPGLGTLWGVVIVAACGCIAGLAPQRLMAGTPFRTSAWSAGAALASSVAGLGVYALFAARGEWGVGCALGVAAACLTAIALVDACVLLIPDLHILALAILAVVGPLALDLRTALIGAAVGGGLLLLVAEAFKRVRGVSGLGFGDVKLMAALGALAGPVTVLWIVVSASVLGAVWIIGRSGGRLDRTGPAPFGAAAALPAIVLLVLERLGR
jgi:leader peptidase (prepilin peptidase)/N-methyltransferase